MPSDGPSGRPLGAPVTGLPETLDELLASGFLIAEEWQTEPVLVEVEVAVEDGRWSTARLVYVAAESERFLQLVATGSGFSQERITLSTLQVEAIPPEAVELIPDFPDDAAQPAALASAEEVSACGVEATASVFYVTGAPVSWDGTQWSPTPQWRVNVIAPDGTGATLDVSGDGADCLG